MIVNYARPMVNRFITKNCTLVSLNLLEYRSIIQNVMASFSGEAEVHTIAWVCKIRFLKIVLEDLKLKGMVQWDIFTENGNSLVGFARNSTSKTPRSTSEKTNIL